MYEMLRDNYQEDQKNVLIEMKRLEEQISDMKNKLTASEDSVLNVEQVAKVFKEFLDKYDESEMNSKKLMIETLFSSISIDDKMNVNLELAFEDVTA